jgi:hypothetical protein
VDAGAPRREIDRLAGALLTAFDERYWHSPWTASWVLLALQRAAAPHHARPAGSPTSNAPWAGSPPSRAVRAWIGVRRLGTRPLRTDVLDWLRWTVPLPDRTPSSITVATGAPPLYFHARLREPHAAPTASPAVNLAVRFEALPHPRWGTGDAALRLGPGASAVGRIAVVTNRSLPETVLRIPIPAGARVVDPGLRRWSEAPRSYGTARFPRLPVLDANVRGAALWLHLEALEPGLYEHQLAIGATTAGRFGCAPSVLQRATDGTLLTTSGPCQPLRVSPRVAGGAAAHRPRPR